MSLIRKYKMYSRPLAAFLAFGMYLWGYHKDNIVEIAFWGIMYLSMMVYNLSKKLYDGRIQK